MSATRLAAPVIALACGLHLGGCFLFHQDSPDGAAVDAGARGDGEVAEAGVCAWYGTTRVCGRHCETPCRDDRDDGLSACVMYSEVCNYRDDERGTEQCGRAVADSDVFTDFCWGERICLLHRVEDPSLPSGGSCVDMEYCRWLEHSGPADLQAMLPCRYSDNTAFVAGPPEEPCGEGSDPVMPFCGGACGDTCPATTYSPVETPGCFGMNEHRAFGVCAPTQRPRCSERVLFDPISKCGVAMQSVGGGGDAIPCVCMRVAQGSGASIPAEGAAVARQSCLAYRARYPDQVSCRDLEWQELP